MLIDQSMSWELAARLMIALLLGGMVFFAFFMAPLVFTKLPAETAGRFIRAVFPWYYDAMAVLSALAALACVLFAPALSAALIANAGVFMAARFALMPAINTARDASVQKDAAAHNRIARLHRASVLLNAAQLVLVLGAAVMLYR